MYCRGEYSLSKETGTRRQTCVEKIVNRGPRENLMSVRRHRNGLTCKEIPSLTIMCRCLGVLDFPTDYVPPMSYVYVGQMTPFT